MKGSGERSRTVAERLREEAGFDHRRTVVSEAALEVDLEVQRFLRAGGGAANETGAELDKLTFEGKFVVRISPDTLRSDDAIVATIAHEVHEITGLRAAFEANGGSPSRGPRILSDKSSDGHVALRSLGRC